MREKKQAHTHDAEGDVNHQKIKKAYTSQEQCVDFTETETQKEKLELPDSEQWSLMSQIGTRANAPPPPVIPVEVPMFLYPYPGSLGV